LLKAHNLIASPAYIVIKAVEEFKDGGEIVPAPARDLEVGEVGLPELVGHRGFVTLS
jgi:hypothetical protein